MQLKSVAAFVKDEDVAGAEARFRDHAARSAGDIAKRKLSELSNDNLQLAEALEPQLRELVKKYPAQMCAAYGYLKNQIATFRGQSANIEKGKIAIDAAGAIPGLNIISSLTSAGITYFKQRGDAVAGAQVHRELSTLNPGSLTEAEELRRQGHEARTEAGLTLATTLIPGASLSRQALRAEAAAVRALARDIKVTESTVQKALERLNKEAGIATRPAKADARTALYLRIEEKCKDISSYACREAMARFQRLGEYKPEYKIAAEEAALRRERGATPDKPLNQPTLPQPDGAVRLTGQEVAQGHTQIIKDVIPHGVDSLSFVERGKHAKALQDRERALLYSRNEAQYYLGASGRTVHDIEKEALSTMEGGFWEKKKNGVLFRFYRAAGCVGFDGGLATDWVRVEVRSGFVHSHPVSPARLSSVYGYPRALVSSNCK